MACTLGLSLSAFAACAGETKYESGYGEENGGTPDVSSEQISADGVLNEDVYGSVRWLRNYVVDPNDFANDIDRAKTLAASAAQLNITAFFRASGMYVAVDVNNEPGEAAFVNNERDESLNSGTELIFQKYKVKLSPSGNYVWEKKQGSAWESYTEAEQSVLGVQAKTAPINETGNTGYVLEFFIPAANLNAMGYDAAALAQGSDTLPLDAVLVTSYGEDDTAAARWEMSSSLAWDDFYEFGKDGAEVYDITVEIVGEMGSSAVAEASLRDYTVPYNDTTFLVKAADGYRLKSFSVNGKAYDVEYIQGGLEKGYVILLTNEVNEDLHVKAEFEKNLPVSFETSVETSRFGEKVLLDGVTVTFENAGQRYSFKTENGKIAGKLPCGVYDVSVSGGLYDPMTVTVGTEGLKELSFEYRAFSSDKFGDAYGGYHDYSRVNSEEGVIENIDGNSFLPITNEAFGDSAFTVTFRYDQMTKDSRLGIRYIWDERTNSKQMRNAVIAEMNMQGGDLVAGWADYSDNWNNYNVVYGSNYKNVLPVAFANSFMYGDGVSLTLVRTGATFDLYAAVAGDDASRIYVMSFTLENDTLEAMNGHWAIYIWDTANGVEVPFKMEEDATAWQKDIYTVVDETESNGGSVSFDENIAVGQPVTFNIVPDASYSILSFTINGEEYVSKVQNNVLTLKENVPLTMTVKAVFGIENYTVDVDLTGTSRAEQGDLSVMFSNASGTAVYGRYNGGTEWKVSLAEDAYDYEVYAFGSFKVKSGNVTVADGGRLTISLSDTDFDIAVSDQSLTGTADILTALGTPSAFVYSGFMGLEGSALADIGNFAAETRFWFANGTTMEVQFVRWVNKGVPTYEFKFMLNDQNVGVSFMLTEAFAPEAYDRVMQDNGVWFTMSVENGVVSAWAKNSSDQWVQLKTGGNAYTWDGVPNNSPIVKVEFRKRYDGNADNFAVLSGAKLLLGTADTGLR